MKTYRTIVGKTPFSMRKYFLISVPILSLIVLNCSALYACWCRNDPEETNTDANFSRTVSHEVTSSDFVFSGTPTAEDPEHITFKIDNIWKGNADDRITFYYLFSPLKETEGRPMRFIDSCAFEFKLGENYLVYANVTLNGLTVSKCGRTSLVGKAQRDIKELNRHK